MSSTVATSSQTRSALRDPVLLLPAVVAAGLAVGWLGVDAGVSGTRVAADLALAWALVAASLVALERARWRRSRVLLAAAAFALLAADLQWASSHGLVDARLPARGSVGGAPRPVRADVSRRAPVVARRPGRDRRRLRGGARRAARRRLRASRLARRALDRAAARPSPTPSTGRRGSSASPSPWRCSSCSCGACSSSRRPGAARAGAAARRRALSPSRRPCSGWCWVSATGERRCDARDDRSRRRAARSARGRRRDRLVAAASTGGVRPRRRAADRRERPACASGSPGCSATRRSRSRIASTTAATSTPPGSRSSSRRARTGRSRW